MTTTLEAEKAASDYYSYSSQLLRTTTGGAAAIKLSSTPLAFPELFCYHGKTCEIRFAGNGFE